MESADQILAKLDSSSLVSWSDQKRSEFCLVFDKRVRASRFILQSMIGDLLDKTVANHMLGQKAYQDLKKKGAAHEFCDRDDFHTYYDRIGGRPISELSEIAEARVKELMRAFPKMVDAVEVIDAVTAKRMRQRDELLEKCKKERDELQSVCEPISMTSTIEEHPDITLKAFLDLVKKKDNRRVELVKSIQSSMDEGVRLEGEIAKALYKGLPGLSEAIEGVIRGYINQDVALGIAGRRVSEQVQFGDSEAAKEILSHFERDETVVDKDVAAKLQEAVMKLGIPVKGRRGSSKRSSPSSP